MPPRKPYKCVLKREVQKSKCPHAARSGGRCTAGCPALEDTPFCCPAGPRGSGGPPSRGVLTRNLSSFSSQRWSSSISCCCRISRSSIRWGGNTCPSPRRSRAAESWASQRQDPALTAHCDALSFFLSVFPKTQAKQQGWWTWGS